MGKNIKRMKSFAFTFLVNSAIRGPKILANAGCATPLSLTTSSWSLTYAAGGAPVDGLIGKDDAFSVPKGCDFNTCTVVEGTAPSSCSTTPVSSAYAWFLDSGKKLEDGNV